MGRTLQNAGNIFRQIPAQPWSGCYSAVIMESKRKASPVRNDIPNPLLSDHDIAAEQEYAAAKRKAPRPFYCSLTCMNVASDHGCGRGGCNDSWCGVKRYRSGASPRLSREGRQASPGPELPIRNCGPGIRDGAEETGMASTPSASQPSASSQIPVRAR